MNGTPEKSDATVALGFPGFAYGDLYQPSRLRDLTLAFDRETQRQDPALFGEFQVYRQCQGEGMSPEAISDLLVRMAPWVGEFVARLFQVESTRTRQKEAIQAEFDGIFAYRNQIVGKLAARFKGQDPSGWDLPAIRQQFDSMLRASMPAARVDGDREAAVAELAMELLGLSQAETPDASALRARLSDPVFAEDLERDDAGLVAALFDALCRWSFCAARLDEFRPEVEGWVSFKVPEKSDFDDLVEHDSLERQGYPVWAIAPEHQRRRDGFALTDPRFPERRVLYEVDHCIYCHDRSTDSCSKGMRNKKEGTYKSNPLGVTLTGCPLEEKISEMHLLKKQGDNIAALALVVIDNPLCPGTGHRICNECMKGCIYQKTEPVNIPQIETHVLTSVLFMPWGFEIYSLLTRWNPLNVKRPQALPYNGKNVLVAGMGPAGYTLSHYLLNEGFAVVGIDGLKIEPLPKEWVGDGQTPPPPIVDFNALYEDLDQRVMLGFGGVAEYGITVRWDKNFLKVIYLNLLRRQAFRCYGGVRFGGALTVNEAWDLGFDHIAIASGAGKPTVIELRNNLTRGIRKASDFLMALQLSGAAKQSSLANLQVRLPAGVIGGGLTAIDTATELLAYY
ncbi:MAG: pyridine nucleotide-disulfide oxidoreductase, partial [Methylococcaceae bacterium]|nr:pyridine nucleotide-disulfide oxidoreductase [Methylococcaceae bacterium]